MTEHCADLDEFFDGELAADQAGAFRRHLGDCQRCQAALHGRMQETMAAELYVPQTEVALPSKRTERRHGRMRLAAYLAPVVAAAAAVPLWLGMQHEPSFELAVAIDRAPVAKRGLEAPRRGLEGHKRGLTAHVGDVMRPAVHGSHHRAIWVYLDDRELILSCPRDGARCRSSNDELAVELPLTARGHYSILALGSNDVIPAPLSTLDEALVLARTTGIDMQVERVDVD
jgi:hypothetical protein